MVVSDHSPFLLRIKSPSLLKEEEGLIISNNESKKAFSTVGINKILLTFAPLPAIG